MGWAPRVGNDKIAHGRRINDFGVLKVSCLFVITVHWEYGLVNNECMSEPSASAFWKASKQVRNHWDENLERHV